MALVIGLLFFIQFQLTHPWGCDLAVLSGMLLYPNFNSHTREGVTTREKCIILVIIPFQLTHPWGCDALDLSKVDFTPIFQLTHPWGCDSTISENSRCFWFQLTHPWGCDFIYEVDKYNRLAISTHTPVRVWLIFTNEYIHLNVISTHTPVRVWRALTQMLQELQTQFQLTHPWGCDTGILGSIRALLDFNSHTREGVTTYIIAVFIWNMISTHTPVRVWHKVTSKRADNVISTHTPVRVWRNFISLSPLS